MVELKDCQRQEMEGKLPDIDGTCVHVFESSQLDGLYVGTSCNGSFSLIANLDPETRMREGHPTDSPMGMNLCPSPTPCTFCAPLAYLSEAALPLSYFCPSVFLHEIEFLECRTWALSPGLLCAETFNLLWLVYTCKNLGKDLETLSPEMCPPLIL